MLGELMPLGGGDPIPLFKPLLRVGRRDSCDIVLNFPNVSSQHAELEFVNGYWQVRNLSRANGTKVNGERVDERFLQPADQVCFAKHCFEISYTPDPLAPPPVIQEENPFAKSLLEKAGLAPRDRGRPPSERPKPVTPPPPPQPKSPQEMDEHDQALGWLLDDDSPSKLMSSDDE